MKKHIVLSITIFHLLFFPSFGQNNKAKASQDESESLSIITNQDIYFAGEKVWYGVKLLRNHDTYRFSKLIYVEIYSPQNEIVHREKLLLDPKEMTYADFILPDNLSDGEYRLFAYTQWMLNFPSYPIASKSVLVKRFNSEESPSEEVQVYYSERDGDYRELVLFHTGSKPLLVEIENSQGRQEAVFEEVPPLKIFHTKIDFDSPKIVKWNKEQQKISPSPIRIIKNKIDIHPSVKPHKVYAHTDLAILEELEEDFESYDIWTNTLPYERQESFQVSIFDQNNQLLAHQYFKKPVKKEMSLSAPISVSRGSSLNANIKSNSLTTNTAIAWIKSPEPAEISELMLVLNDPTWRKVGEASTKKGNYIKAVQEINQLERPKFNKEFLPLMEYNPLQKTLAQLKPELFTTNPLTNLPNFNDFTASEMNRKVFHEHFEYDLTVSVPVSPYRVDYTYDVQDYIGYQTTEIFLKEVVSQIKIRENKSSGKKEIRIFNPNKKRSDFKSLPLLMIDFHKVEDPAVLLGYDISQLDRIELIYEGATIDETNLGALSENGVVAFFTRKNDYQLKFNVPRSQYVLKELSVPRIMAREYIHPEASSKVTLQKPQTWHPSIPLVRGKSQFSTKVLDEPGKMTLEAWVFDRMNATKIFTTVEVK